MKTPILWILGVVMLSTASHAMAAGGDTSGCSTSSSVKNEGPVTVAIQRPPHDRCWNIQSSGVQVTYSWPQANNPNSERSNLGFWVSLNGREVYVKATHYECRPERRPGYGHDTSGHTRYLCSASKTLQFRDYPNLLTYAYNGTYNTWDIQVAVSLDDHGNWDSRGGQNYWFRF